MYEDDYVSPSASSPNAHGVWGWCNRCGAANWCIGDPAGEEDYLTGDLLDLVCWDFCAGVEDDEDL